jgi:hypothetical protein
MVELRRLGLRETELDIGVPKPNTYHIIEDEELPAGTGRRIVRGLMLGAPLGSLAGLGVVEAIAWLVPGAAFLRLSGVVVGLVGGAQWGMAVGAFSALLAKTRQQEGCEHRVTIERGGTDVVVLARGGAQADRVRGLMRMYGARFFLDEVELADDTTAFPDLTPSSAAQPRPLSPLVPVAV